MSVNNDKKLHLDSIYADLNFIHKEQRAEVLNQLIKNCVLLEKNGAIVAGPNCKIPHETPIYTKKEYQEMKQNPKTDHSVKMQVQYTVASLTRRISNPTTTTTIDQETQTKCIKITDPKNNYVHTQKFNNKGKLLHTMVEQN